MIPWFKRTLQLTAVLILAQVVGALLLDDRFPVELYEPVASALLLPLPDEWKFRGNILLGLGAFVLVFAIFAFVLAAAFTTCSMIAAKKLRRNRGSSSGKTD